MAIDEAILLAGNSGQSGVTLRLYRWDEPTISLGYFQKYEEFTAQDGVIARMPVVRRQTGGGAILHDDELTYSLMLPINELERPMAIETMYRHVHDAYIESLRKIGVNAEYRGGDDKSNAQRGPFFCFARTHRLDLVIKNDKLLGSAQRRMKNAALQHGSLIMGRHFDQQPSASVKSAMPASVDFDEGGFVTDLIARIADALSLRAIAGKLTEAEVERLPELREKYGSDAWNRLR